MARSFLDIFLGRPETVQKSNGWDSIEKSLLDAESIEKSKKGVRRAQHKYIRVFTGNNGKDQYLYPEDLAKPFKLLLSAFGIGKEKVEETYQANNIERAYGVDKNVFGAHLLEYLTNRVKWDTLFKNKAERDKNKEPVAQKVVEDNAAKKRAEKAKTVKDAAESTGTDNKKKMTVNRSLMRKIYSLYNPVPEDKADPAVEQKIEPTPVTPEVKPALEKIKEFVGRKTMKRPDGITVMTWPDGRIIHTDKKGGVVYDNYSLDTQSVVDTASEVPTVHRVEDTSTVSGGNGSGGDGNEPPESNKKRFSDLTSDDKKQIKEQIESNIVSSIPANSVPYNGDNKYGKAAKEWIEKNPQGNAFTEIGEVIINKASVDNDLHHGAKENLYIKLQTLPAVKDVLEKGVYIGYEHNKTSNDDIDNHYFAGKINYGGEEKIVFCRVREAAGDTERFYVHEVFTEDEIKKGANSTVADVDPSLLTGTPLYEYILRDILNVNTDTSKLSQAMIGNDNAKKDGVEADKNANSKPGYTEGEKAAITLAYRKEKDFDPTLSDYAYYEKIKAKFPELDAKGELYRTMLNVKNLMISERMFRAAKEYLKSKESVIEQTESSGEPVNNGQTFDDGYKVISEDKTFKNQLINGTITIESLKEVHRQGVENGHESQSYADGVIQAAEDVMKEHGNKIAMLGNQNARKDGLTEEEKKIYDREYNWYKETYVDGIREQNPYTNEEETIADILKDEADERLTVYGENDIAYKALKDLYTDTTGKEYVPTKKNIAKPLTDSEMKKEQEEEKKARKEAGLSNPGNNIGDRVSAIDDADTWNPNSENYRFKDTGYIAGSRKELAQEYIISRARSGSIVDAKHVDFDALEENPRMAEKLITKSNIFGDVDWDGLREKGMSGSAAFLIDRIYASAGAKPDESNASARKQYVIALNGLRDRFEECKTVDQVIDELKEIRDEFRGEYVEIREMPEYKKITDKMESLGEVIRNKRNELSSLSERAGKFYEVEKQKVIEKYIQKGKDEKLLRWNTRNSYYNIPKKYLDDFEKETKGLWEKAYAPWKKAVADFKAELISKGVKEEDFFTNKNTYMGKTVELSWFDYYTLMPEMQEYSALKSELDAYVKKMKVAVSMKNPLLEAWKSLGKRFTDILYSDSFNAHKYDCAKGKYDDWGWLAKDAKIVEKKITNKQKKFELLTATEIKRKGGRDFNITSTAELKKAFNLRDVQSGNWVLNDPESAGFHVKNAAMAFADLADITGIPDNKISLNGRLAMAFGARGTGNAGGRTAVAHYESVERVINMTKMKGGGSLGHEWFHAFDNMITSAMTGDDSKDVFLTNAYLRLSDSTKRLVEEYVSLKDGRTGSSFNAYANTYKMKQIAKKLEAKGFDVAKLNDQKSELQVKIQGAFDKLVREMTTGDSDLYIGVKYKTEDYKKMLVNFSEDAISRDRLAVESYGREPSLRLKIADAGSLDKAIDEINATFGVPTDAKAHKNKSDWVKITVAYYDRNPNGIEELDPIPVKSGEKGSRFLADANELENFGRDYWSTTHEMAARAFSAYLEDTLKDQGRQNDYLTYKAENKYYEGNPYPEGEERKRINAAFKELFDIVKQTNAIQKAIEWDEVEAIHKSMVWSKIENNPIFVIKGDKFLIRK